MKLTAVVTALVLAGIGTASAETWYWSPKLMEATGKYYPWSISSNWVTSVGESSRGTGTPAKGDTIIMGETSRQAELYNPNKNVPLQEIRIGPVGPVNINQGGIGLLAGGNGLQYLATASQAGNWSRLRFFGTGEVPINIANDVTYAMQMAIELGSGNPIIVKQGPGRFVCYNQGGGTTPSYQVALTLIRQGSWDMSAIGVYSGLTIAFDGNDESQRLQFGYAEGWGPELTFKNSALIETNGVANTGHGIFDNNRGRQIAFTGTPKVNPMVFSGTFYGKAGLRWSPSSASYVFVCSNAVSATGGKFSVEKGTVKLVTGASLTSLSELAVSAGAVFEIEEGSGRDFSATTLTISDATAKLKLASGVSLAINGATVGGAAISPGTYTANGGEGLKQADWIEGDGQVVVATGPEAAFVWKGGAAGGNSVFLAGNWTDGGEPDLTNGTLLATFASSGSEALLPAGETASFSGIVLNNETGNGSFAFTAGEGSSATVGVNGLLASSSAATDWQIGWPIAFAGDQTLSFGANDTLTFSSGFSGADALTVDGSGTLVLSAPSAHTGSLTLAQGTVRVLATDALGSVGQTITGDLSKVYLSFGGVGTKVNSALSLSNPDSSTTNGLKIEDNADVTFAQQIQSIGRHTFTLGTGAVAIWAGGYLVLAAGMIGALTVCGTDGRVIVTNGTITANFFLETKKDSTVDFDFWSAGNCFNASRYYDWTTFNGRVALHVPDAFVAKSWIHLYSSSVLDLLGNDQTITWFHAEEGAQVTSAAPALLTVLSPAISESQDNSGAGDSNRVDRAVFAGAVSFKKTGVNPHAFGAASTSTGEVEVASGTLRLTSTGSWANAATVRVSGGTLLLENPDAFGTDTVWRVTSSAKVTLNHTGTNVTDRLYVDGHRASAGIYAASDNTGDARHRPAWLSGTGFLSVKEHGLVLYLK